MRHDLEVLVVHDLEIAVHPVATCLSGRQVVFGPDRLDRLEVVGRVKLDVHVPLHGVIIPELAGVGNGVIGRTVLRLPVPLPRLAHHVQHDLAVHPVLQPMGRVPIRGDAVRHDA
jgi:hypothetical protein